MVVVYCFLPGVTCVHCLDHCYDGDWLPFSKFQHLQYSVCKGGDFFGTRTVDRDRQENLQERRWLFNSILEYDNLVHRETRSDTIILGKEKSLIRFTHLQNTILALVKMTLAAEVTGFIVLQDPIQFLEDCAAIYERDFELGFRRDVIYDKFIIKTKAITF